MTEDFSAIVTGAASGVGASVALKLAQPGVRLSLHTRRSIDRLEGVAEQARAKGAEVELITGDLAEPGQGKKIIAAHEARFGSLDALVANAGFPLLLSLADMELDDIAYAFRGNTQSLFELVQASHSLLRASSNARIVAVSSFTAHVFRTDMPQFPASAASKGAVETAVRSLSLALAKDGITVNSVVPGYIQKDEGTGDGLDDDTLNEIRQRIPLQRLGMPQDVANCICFLLSEQASYVTGQVIHVNGGLI
ncbi:SDR family NAD(P)-dependent oxidoreductase [Ruegeria sp.]|uniref:SDR family NAD(P)-dependent oxidoreductase n=1 Tax=Ruegeria sp. TaxID=1879320 RepID=UPI003B596BB1